MSNDDLEEVDVEEDIGLDSLSTDESDDVISISKWITSSVSHLITVILIVVVIIALIIGVKYMYGKLGNPDTHQQSGVGLLELEKD